MKAQHHPSDLSTPCLRRNLWLCISSLMKTLPQDSSDLLGLPMEPQSFSFRKKMALFDFVSTSEALTEISKKRPISITAHFRPLRHTTESMDLYQNRPSACIPPHLALTWRRMEDCLPNSLWIF